MLSNMQAQEVMVGGVVKLDTQEGKLGEEEVKERQPGGIFGVYICITPQEDLEVGIF